ncbi:MAG: Nudix family hydrolase [Gammaproteobacteria bacterium]|nr:Nudix family hydrolase [Gammaproteobacteria bacterium]
MSDIIHVAVAVIVNESNEVCISLRHKDSHQGGLWEFPGGKIEKDETVEQALFREVKEELNMDIEESRPLITIKHNYQDKKVCLHVNRVTSYRGKAIGVEGQRVKWVPVNQISSYEFPAANLSIIKAVQLPEKYLITGKFIDNDDFINKLKNALNNEIKLVQLRLKNNSLKDLNQLQTLVEQTAVLCKQAGAKLMLNLSNDSLDQIDLSKIEFAGFHADSKTLQALSQRPGVRLFSASCHNKEEMLKAKQLNSDFMVLSPVQKTASHPEMQAMGWLQFSSLIENVSIPVYALGGVSEKDIKTAWLSGAQGVAAISAFWK